MSNNEFQAVSMDRRHSPDGRRRGYLAVACFIAALGGFLFGFDTAVISGTVVYLKKQFQLDALLEGWVVSSALIGCILGAAVAGTISDRFGRKKVLIVSAMLFLISALLSAIPQSVAMLVAARLIGGMGVGIASMLSPMYIAELSPPHLRGRLVALYQLAITVGILVAYFSNALLQHLAVGALADMAPGSWRWILVDEVWRGMFGAESLPALVFLLLLSTVPESPRWLTKQGRGQQALDILTRVVGHDEAAREMAEIRKAIAQEGASIGELLKPGLRVALIIGILLPLFSQVSGINVIIYYGVKIFERAGLQIGGSLGGQVVIGIGNVLFTLIAVATVDRVGRKPLLYVGISGLVLGLLAIGLLFHFRIESGVLLIGLFAFYILCFAFSLGPIPWIIISEIFPTRIRGRAMSVGTFTIWSACTAVAQTFPWLLENLGPSGTFWLYALLVAPALPFAWWVIPETKGRSLEEIELAWHRP